jgi:hypothetical protein
MAGILASSPNNFKPDREEKNFLDQKNPISFNDLLRGGGIP